MIAEKRFNNIVRVGRHNVNLSKVSQSIETYTITAIYKPIKVEIPRKTDLLVKEPAFGDRIE